MSELPTPVADPGPEPLLPIEKKLIGWSLGIGLVLLALLVVLNRYLPIPV